MAHEILEHDQMISGRNITPWHELGEIKDSFDIKDLQRIMSWEVKKHRLYTLEGKKTDAYATIRMPDADQSEQIILGAGLSESYKILQNRELIQIIEPFVEKGCALETAGTLKNGQRVWVLLRLGNDLHVGKNDVIQKYIMISNDHTGKQAARFGLVGIRVVCQNTLNVAEKEGKENKLIRVLHNGNIVEKLETVASMLDHMNGKFTNYGICLETLASKGVNAKDLKAYIENCFFGHWSKEKKDKNVSRLVGVNDKIMELFETGAGSDLPEAKGTYYGAYQAVNAHLNHNRDIPLDTRLPSLLWGNRAIFDKRALSLALKMAA